jgi:hypothetical protein
MEDYNMAISIDNDLDKTYFNRGVLKFLMGNPEEGCKDIRESSALGNLEATSKSEKYCQ